MKNTKKNISIEKLHPFENHPYKVQDNEEMDILAESIKAHGVVSPIIVRPLETTASNSTNVKPFLFINITSILCIIIQEKKYFYKYFILYIQIHSQEYV